MYTKLKEFESYSNKKKIMHDWKHIFYCLKHPLMIQFPSKICYGTTNIQIFVPSNSFQGFVIVW